MCLAIPGQIKTINKSQQAMVNFNGISKKINCQLVVVKKNDWVIVHAGFAIQKLKHKDAKEILKLYGSVS